MFISTGFDVKRVIIWIANLRQFKIFYLNPCFTANLCFFLSNYSERRLNFFDPAKNTLFYFAFDSEDNVTM